jgi:Tfp pilus assembly protein PilF
MSRTLNLMERLLARGRRLGQVGAGDAAQRTFARLADFRRLPQDVASEVQLRLGELSLRSHDFASARRHLAAVLVADPDHARGHYLMALAASAGQDRQPERALRHFRRSLQLQPNHPWRLTAYGLAALRAGKTRTALRALRRAFELRMDDPRHVSRIVEGLDGANCWSEAKELARRALFRHPRDARLRLLWDCLRFRAARRAQERERHDASQAASETPVLLPFVRPAIQKAGARRGQKAPGDIYPLAPASGSSRPSKGNGSSSLSR